MGQEVKVQMVETTATQTETPPALTGETKPCEDKRERKDKTPPSTKQQNLPQLNLEKQNRGPHKVAEMHERHAFRT